jgi:hypothetical protein
MISKDKLREASITDLIRLAKFLGLKKDLDIMKKKNLIKLILWKLRRDAPFEIKTGWSF